MRTTDIPAANGGLTRAGALRFVVLLGVVSLFADMTYEGARSALGPFLAELGASGAQVGFVAGFGELLGYGLRLASGYLADSSRRYWLITFLGYCLNVLAVPFLALAGHWQSAAGLSIAERVGKAVRTPPRDSLLAAATSQIGHGWGFALHEALDQVGAVCGPLLVALVRAVQGSFPPAFAVLLVPALITLFVLVLAWRLYRRTPELDPAQPESPRREKLPREFWIAVAAASLIAAGFADFPLLAYHLGKRHVLAAPSIPILYAVAMAIAALSALVLGWLFDRGGRSVLWGPVLLSAPCAALVLWGGPALALLGVSLWGVGSGMQGSILRALVARIVPAAGRATAFGAFNASFGVAWFLGSALLGACYDISIGLLVAFSVGAQLASLPLLWRLGKRS